MVALVPSGLSCARAMSRPTAMERFHDPWAVMKRLPRHAGGSTLPVYSVTPRGAQCAGIAATGARTFAGF